MEDKEIIDFVNDYGERIGVLADDGNMVCGKFKVEYSRWWACYSALDAVSDKEKEKNKHVLVTYIPIVKSLVDGSEEGAQS